ncbi:MAG: hypothetical protein WCT32_01695 [Patescibacteria group bacterium]|jgi:hypothetical protein
MDNSKRPVFLGILGIAIVITIVWQVVNRRSDEAKQTDTTGETATQQILNITNVDPADFDSIIEQELSLANIKATNDNPKNKLAAVIIELPADLAPNNGTVRYIYSSDDDQENNWMITISQANSRYIRASIPKEDYLGDLRSINLQLWKFNYVTALKIAENNGGLKWRESNDLSGIKLSLQHLAPQNWLQWIVEYSGPTGTFVKNIDANSGQVIEATTENQ